MNSAGTVASTASANTIEMIMGGFLGSDRKMWWISASLPYRSGFSGTSTAAVGSSLTLKSKTGVTEPSEEPKDAIIRLAERGPSERSSWPGRSFCDCPGISYCSPMALWFFLLGSNVQSQQIPFRSPLRSREKAPPGRIMTPSQLGKPDAVALVWSHLLL